MQESIRGRVIKMPFDNVSTDVIAPSRYRSTTGEDPELLALRPWIMGALRPGLNDVVKPGDVFEMHVPEIGTLRNTIRDEKALAL